jgi:hypothetical protein
MVGLSCISQELTQSKMLEESLRESSGFLTEVQSIARLGTYSFDVKTQKWRSSAILDEIFGIDNTFEKNTANWFSIVHPGWVDEMQHYFFDNVLLKHGNFDREYKIVRLNDKAERWVHGRGELRFDENNELCAMIGTITDITERKDAESELISARMKAEESDRLKTAFLDNMSHEIRTPMNGILGFADLLKSPDITGEQQHEYLRIIKKSGDRMLNIINDIIDISKIESGQMTISIAETNINDQIEYIYNYFKPEADRREIRFIYQNSLLNKYAIIETDRAKLYTILNHLVKNAFKFCDSGIIELGYNVRNAFVEFYVKDSGPGIPFHRQKAIFERFVQADIADIKAFQGAGLGLTIAKAYVEMLGGEIWVESEEGRGAIFYFTLPTCEKKEIRTIYSQSQKINMEKAKRINILIAEDDETSEMLITMALKPFSKEIYKAVSGEEAVNTIRQNPDIDLVLMDIKMAEMDGYEATRLIRQFNTNVIIIAQTAFGLSGDREKAIAAGCNDYISKPINLTLLKEMVKKYFMI